MELPGSEEQSENKLAESAEPFLLRSFPKGEKVSRLRSEWIRHIFLNITRGQATLHFWQILAPRTTEPHGTSHRGGPGWDVLLHIPHAAKYLWKGALLGQWTLIHVFQEVLQSVPHGGVRPLFGRQVFQFGATMCETEIRKGIITRLHPAAKHSFKTDRFHFAHQTDASGDCSRSPDCSD